MEFWGVEVKAGAEVVCEPGRLTYLHLSQAALGETKKAQENVLIHVKVDDQDLVLGTLSGDKFPQASFDIVFEKNFKVSHTSKSASVYLTGYKSAMSDDDDIPSDFESDEEDEPLPLAPKSNGLVMEQNKSDKSVSVKGDGKAKPKGKAEVKPVEDEASSDSDEDSDEDSDDDESASDDDDINMPDAEGDDSDDEDDSSEEDVTPKKVETGKKRSSDSVSNAAAPEKKAKLATPVGKKTDVDGKKGSHTATPHPAKQSSKTPATSEKSKQQSPKSAGSSVSCKSCSKTFNSEKALESHSKAKHEAK